MSPSRWLAPLVFALAMLPFAAAAAESDEDAFRCLALAIYWEARSEGRDGMTAIGAVVFNRMRHPGFPDTVCGVVKQGGEAPGCQFSWWCDGRSDVPREAGSWALAQEVARAMLRRPFPDPTHGALYFHAAGITMPWQVERERTARIGNHIYYR